MFRLLMKVKFSVSVCLDPSKPFDTIDHTILFSKSEYYWARGLALDCFKSYFIERTQCVDISRRWLCIWSESDLLCPLMYCKGLFLALVYILYVNDLSPCIYFICEWYVILPRICGWHYTIYNVKNNPYMFHCCSWTPDFKVSWYGNGKIEMFDENLKNGNVKF